MAVHIWVVGIKYFDHETKQIKERYKIFDTEKEAQEFFNSKDLRRLSWAHEKNTLYIWEL